jgi:hypothetical protein
VLSEGGFGIINECLSNSVLLCVESMFNYTKVVNLLSLLVAKMHAELVVC